MQVASRTQSLAIEFGGELSTCSLGESGAKLALGAPLLAGSASQPLLDSCTISERDGFVIGETETRLAGIAAIDVPNTLEDPSYQIYRSLLGIVGERQIHRVWNYVPDINSVSGELENYRAFNIGRHRAFEDSFGANLVHKMAPASAVGIRDRRLAVAFLAGDDPLENVENPEQIPAYRYPSEHGPKSPSFTRGGHGIIDGTPVGFLSGTSSIKDHRSVGGSDLGGQFNTTLDNMRIVIERMGYSGALGDGAGMEREFTFYLRNADDLGAARELFRNVVGDDGIEATRFLCADICRAELLLEIEGIFRRP